MNCELSFLSRVQCRAFSSFYGIARGLGVLRACGGKRAISDVLWFGRVDELNGGGCNFPFFE